MNKLILLVFLAFSVPYGLSMEIPGHRFELVEQTGPVPYVSGPAFWRTNGEAIEVTSHCGEEPGDFFHGIENGDDIFVKTVNGQIISYTVAEIIRIRYENVSDPYSGYWVNEGSGDRHSVMGLTEEIMQPGNLVIHTCICRQGIAFGQVIIVAVP